MLPKGKLQANVFRYKVHYADSAVYACVRVVPHNVSHCVPRSSRTGGQTCGLPRQQLQFIFQPGPSGSSRDIPGGAFANPRHACFNPRRAFTSQANRRLGDAVNHHSLKTNFIPTHAGAPAVAESSGEELLCRQLAQSSRTEVILLRVWTLT